MGVSRYLQGGSKHAAACLVCSQVMHDLGSWREWKYLGGEQPRHGKVWICVYAGAESTAAWRSLIINALAWVACNTQLPREALAKEATCKLW
jgi:hypothetical protein